MSDRDGGSYLTTQDMKDLKAEGAQRLKRHQDHALILEEVQLERTRQDVQWGGVGHDDLHSSHDWVAYLVRHTGKAVVCPFDLGTFRRQMVRVAALAVAAVEWVDRRIEEGGTIDE